MNNFDIYAFFLAPMLGVSIMLLTGWLATKEKANLKERWNSAVSTDPAADHSFYSSNRQTHLKIVAVALLAGIVVAGIGVSARSGGAFESYYVATAKVIKAGIERLFAERKTEPRS